MIEETNLDICGCKNDSLDLKNIDRKLRLNARNQVQHSQKATAKIRGKNYSCVMLANKQLQRMPKLLCGKFRFKDMWPCSCVLNGLNRLLRPDVLYGQSLPSTSSQLTEAEKFLADLLNCRCKRFPRLLFSSTAKLPGTQRSKYLRWVRAKQRWFKTKLRAAIHKREIMELTLRANAKRQDLLQHFQLTDTVPLSEARRKKRERMMRNLTRCRSSLRSLWQSSDFPGVTAKDQYDGSRF